MIRNHIWWDEANLLAVLKPI